MTILKDRLPGTIRIKKRFAPSRERVRTSRNRVIQVIYVTLGLILLAVFLRWLEL
jgi:hypothetical protein